MLEVINPANEQVCGYVALGNEVDVDKAVAAAKSAFASYGRTTQEERIAVLESVIASYQRNFESVASAIIEEMGAPKQLAYEAQAASGIRHLEQALATLKSFEFEECLGTTRVLKEPIGVCGMITPGTGP